MLAYLKSTHKNHKFGKVRQVPTRELPTKFPPWLGLVSLFQIWDFCGYSLNTLKYPKMGIFLLFPVQVAAYHVRALFSSSSESLLFYDIM